jgi:succinyl-diaminopimelate desuccinylase
MKGGCASILAACEALVNLDIELPAMLAFVCDEETGGVNGIQRLLASGTLKPGDCLIAEPSPLRNPSIGQKGLCRLDIRFSGTPAHGSLYPAVGVSAIMEAMEFLEYVKGLHGREFAVDDHLREILARSSAVLGQEFHITGVSEVLKKLTFNPGVISGGEKSNVVAQNCALELELRIPWGCPIDDLVADISAHARNGNIVSQETHKPSITDPACPLVTITCDEVRRVYGGDVFPIVQWAASDARHLRLRGFNVLEYGPGEISTLHAVNERVTIDSLEKAAIVYQGVMQKYASTGKTT